MSKYRIQINSMMMFMYTVMVGTAVFQKCHLTVLLNCVMSDFCYKHNNHSTLLHGNVFLHEKFKEQIDTVLLTK